VKIAISEPFPFLEERLKLRIRQSHPKPFPELEPARIFRRYNLLISDRNVFSGDEMPFSELYLIPNFARLIRPARCGLLLSGGMHSSDSVTLSSIGEDHAMLCLQQEIRICGTDLGPFEQVIPFNRNDSLYHNLAMGFSLALTEALGREETKEDALNPGTE